MPIRITCPSCDAKMSVGDNLAGKAVKCPKCAGRVPVPAPVVEEDPFEVVDEPAPRPTPQVRKPAPRLPVSDEDDFEPPARPAAPKPTPRLPEKDLEDEDDFDDGAPRKPAKKAGKASRSAPSDGSPRLTSAPKLIGIVSTIVLIPTIILGYLLSSLSSGVEKFQQQAGANNFRQNGFGQFGQNAQNGNRDRIILGPVSDKANLVNFKKIEMGKSTLSEATDILGPGQVVNDLSSLHIGNGTNNTGKFQKYLAGANCWVWQNETTVIILGSSMDRLHAAGQGESNLSDDWSLDIGGTRRRHIQAEIDRAGLGRHRYTQARPAQKEEDSR